MQNDPKIREMVEKQAQHPGAVAAISKLGELLKTKGVARSVLWDVHTHTVHIVIFCEPDRVDPGSSPNCMQLVKLMMGSEVREAAVKLNEEMHAAGIDMDPNVFFQTMKEK
ncbi:hypothetical protein B0I35DRAFT_445042 [Stachybotrys elegans]|uniref:Uncharacterized protein n=1 Tax=Stachybotrys elegans TaxID=80388 RepID=A0A8K0SEX5_9HYPO|nr:hypothetical protein B0I35DRAFT_445042 [Stachybotrys elegans]